ncbi:Gfa-like protein [Minicystis rosea]|nr:Gfa-like protein [Minicystis rosea]
MSETKTYTGGCHCGKVRFEVETEVSSVIACNCSICQKTGTLLTFVPVDKFKLLSGEDSLADYQFNKHVIHHLFCTTCGIRSFAKGKRPDGAEMRAINVRALDGVELDKLSVQHFDGRSR